MKKRLSLMTAAAISFSMLTAFPANAEGNTSADLPALASSLGADSGYFLRNSSAYIQNEDDILNRSTFFYYKYDYALSAIQALVHNGVIKPEDIKSGAENLTDIDADESVNGIIEKYSESAAERAAWLYFGYEYCHTSQADMVKKLIDTAETSMKNNRYFLIAIKNDNNLLNTSTSSAFTMTGIGIADGSWTFDGVTYDKCILTLAPSSSKAPEDNGEIQTISNKNMGFQERYCIYVDSATGKFTVPAHHGCTDEKYDIYIVCDNDEILNYKGAVSPVNEFPEDISDIQFIRTHNASNLDYIINEVHSGKYSEPSETLCENYFSAMPDNLYYFDKGNPYRIETTAGKGAFHRNYTDFEVDMYSENADKHIDIGGAFIADISDTGLKLVKKPESFTTGKEWVDSDNEKYVYKIHLDEPLYGLRTFAISGRSKGTVNYEIRDNGVYISDTERLRVRFSCDKEVPEDFNSYGISVVSDEPVMLRLDNEDEMLYIYRDGDGSGEFTEKVQTGDVNCDGRLDAKDASMILGAYADYSGGNVNASFIGQRYADFNGDGTLNAADASAVLKYYADLAAETK